MRTAVIVDYGMGNIGSVKGALAHIGARVEVSSDPRTVEKFSLIILPGVGSFFKAMNILERSGLSLAIQEAVTGRGSDILGICLGMQLLAEYGEEGGGRQGLGLTPGRIERFQSKETGKKAMHIGYSPVSFEVPGRLNRGVASGTDFYFVHEYRLSPLQNGEDWNYGMCNHSEKFVASFERDNVMGVQFHPEKSQSNGLKLLRNVAEG